jgi:hypothetical protein
MTNFCGNFSTLTLKATTGVDGLEFAREFNLLKLMQSARSSSAILCYPLRKNMFTKVSRFSHQQQQQQQQ